jgi:hypothetical protein
MCCADVIDLDGDDQNSSSLCESCISAGLMEPVSFLDIPVLRVQSANAGGGRVSKLVSLRKRALFLSAPTWFPNHEFVT